MRRIFKRIKNKFWQLKKPTEDTKQFFTLSFWIFGVYVGINLFPVINNLLLQLPSGLFFVLLLNIFVIFWLSSKTYFDYLAVKRAFQEKDTKQLIINGIYAINQLLFIAFNIYQILCLTNTH